MKQFVNRATEITMPNEEGTGLVKMNFAHLAVICLNHQPQGGFSLDEMEERLPIISKLKEDRDTPGTPIELEDTQVKKIRKQADAMASQWAFMHEDVITFTKYIRDLDDEKVDSPEEPVASNQE